MTTLGPINLPSQGVSLLGRSLPDFSSTKILAPMDTDVDIEKAFANYPAIRALIKLGRDKELETGDKKWFIGRLKAHTPSCLGLEPVIDQSNEIPRFRFNEKNLKTLARKSVLEVYLNLFERICRDIDTYVMFEIGVTKFKTT